MRKKSPDQAAFNNIDEDVRRAFGADDEQLAAEYDRMADEMASVVPLPAPEGEFEKILARVEENQMAQGAGGNISAAGETTGLPSADAEADRGTSFRWLVMAVAAGFALAFIGIMSTGIRAAAEKYYEYWGRAEGKTENIYNNVDNKESDAVLELAYAKIKEELGIHVVELGYIPEGMMCEEYSISDQGVAELTFYYKEKYAYFFQIIGGVDNSTGLVTDREEYEHVYNEYLEQEIPIYCNDIEDGQCEFGARFSVNKYIYYFSAQMEEEEFIKIVENFKYYDK